MPVYSMTGYASAQSQGAASTGPEDKAPAARLGMEIRCVNSRFLDLSFRLSEDLRQHEPMLRELLQSRLKRGKVEVRAGVESGAAGGLRDPSPRLLQRLGAMQDQVIGWLPQARALSVADVLRLAAGDESGAADAAAGLPALAEQALEALLAARAREGARLVTMLRGHLQQLRELADQARPLVPQLVEQQRTRFLERWQEAMGLGQQAGAPAASDAAHAPPPAAPTEPAAAKSPVPLLTPLLPRLGSCCGSAPGSTACCARPSPPAPPASRDAADAGVWRGRMTASCCAIGTGPATAPAAPADAL